jgi:uncharacterized protein (TIGR02145 family)
MRVQLTKIALTASVGLALAFTLSCSSGGDDNNNGGGGNGNGGGGSCNISGYRTAKIGSHTWMAQNLNCDVSGSKCYDNDPASCTKYGRLYDWSAAKSACPGGWHLPSDEEWDALVTAVGGSSTAGTKLKSKSGWNNDGNGTDDYGFSALPGGLGYSAGNFNSVGDNGNWWSSTENNASNAYYRNMYYLIAFVGRNNNDKSNYFSVRCVQD